MLSSGVHDDFLLTFFEIEEKNKNKQTNKQQTNKQKQTGEDP